MGRLKLIPLSGDCLNTKSPQILAVVTLTEGRMAVPQCFHDFPDILLLDNERARRQTILLSFIAANGSQNSSIDRNIDRRFLK